MDNLPPLSATATSAQNVNLSVNLAVEEQRHRIEKDTILHSLTLQHRSLIALGGSNKALIVAGGVVLEKVLPYISVPGLPWTANALAITEIGVAIVTLTLVVLSFGFLLSDVSRINRKIDAREDREDDAYYARIS